jgi:hypothetical protein
MKEVDAFIVKGSLINYKCKACKATHQHGYGGATDSLVRWSHCPKDDFQAIHLNVVRL